MDNKPSTSIDAEISGQSRKTQPHGPAQLHITCNCPSAAAPLVLCTHPNIILKSILIIRATNVYDYGLRPLRCCPRHSLYLQQRWRASSHLRLTLESPQVEVLNTVTMVKDWGWNHLTIRWPRLLFTGTCTWNKYINRCRYIRLEPLDFRPWKIRTTRPSSATWHKAGPKLDYCEYRGATDNDRTFDLNLFHNACRVPFLG